MKLFGYAALYIIGQLGAIAWMIKPERNLWMLGAALGCALLSFSAVCELATMLIEKSKEA